MFFVSLRDAVFEFLSDKYYISKHTIDLGHKFQWVKLRIFYNQSSKNLAMYSLCSISFTDTYFVFFRKTGCYFASQT